MEFSRFRPYLIWACAASFYMYQFILRVSPSVMLDELMAYYQISASEVGALAAVAMYSYALLQIPSGILADILGVRKVVLGSILCCILGVLLFISTDHLLLAKSGRLLIGAGSAAAFLCVGKISAQWFSPGKRATLFGMTMAAGTLGALNGSTPLSYLVASMGWRGALLATTLLGVIVFILNLIFLKDHTPASMAETQPHSLTAYKEQILATLKMRVSWLTGLTALGIYLSISVMADLWGVSFLVQAYSLPKQKAAELASLIYVGLCVGALTLSILSDYIRNRRGVILFSVISLLVLLAVLLFSPGLPLFLLSILLFLIGFFSGAEMLCFASAVENSNLALAGTVTGFINCLVMLGGAVLQEQVGKLLDVSWSGGFAPDGLRLYTTQDYQLALSVMLVTIAGSIVTAFFIPKMQAKN